MKAVRILAGTILLLGLAGVLATADSAPRYVASDLPRAVPGWVWCALVAAAAAVYLTALRSTTARSIQIRAASATAAIIGATALLYSGALVSVWVQIVLRLS